MSSAKHVKHKNHDEKEINNIDLNAIVGLIDSMDINQMSTIISSFGLKPNNELVSQASQVIENGADVIVTDANTNEDKKDELISIMEGISGLDKGELLDKIVALYVVNKILKK